MQPIVQASLYGEMIIRIDRCWGLIVSKIDQEYDFDEVLKSKERVFVLFYASWCPYSKRFLPIFERFAKDATRKCVRIMIDDKASLSEKYSVEIVPTVLIFENGKVSKRLDGVPGAGLDEKQLLDLCN